MKRTFIFLLFVVFFHSSLSAQVRNVRYDENGQKHNTALWDDVFIHVFGEDTMSNWLDSKRFSIRYQVDYRGKLLSIDSIWGRHTPNLSEYDIAKLMDYINTNDILFPIIYTYDPDMGDDREIIDRLFLPIANNRSQSRFDTLKPRAATIVINLPGVIPRYRDSIQDTEIGRLKRFIKCNSLPTIRELLIQDSCLIQLDDGRIVSVDGYSAGVLSESRVSVHYDSYLFCAYDELSADISSGKRTVSSYIFDHVLYLMERGMNPSCVDYDYFKDHMFDPGSILSRYNLKNDGTESNVRVMEILSGLYTEKYGRTDYFNQQCLKRIAEMSQYIPDSRP